MNFLEQHNPLAEDIYLEEDDPNRWVDFICFYWAGWTTQIGKHIEHLPSLRREVDLMFHNLTGSACHYLAANQPNMNRIAAVTCLREAIADLIEIGRMMSGAAKQDGWYAQLQEVGGDLIDQSQAFSTHAMEFRLHGASPEISKRFARIWLGYSREMYHGTMNIEMENNKPVRYVSLIMSGSPPETLVTPIGRIVRLPIALEVFRQMKERYWTKLHETVDKGLASDIRANIGPDMAQLSLDMEHRCMVEDVDLPTWFDEFVITKEDLT